MGPMIHAQRNCEDQEKIELFLTKTRTGLLGLADGHQPYVCLTVKPYPSIAYDHTP